MRALFAALLACGCAAGGPGTDQVLTVVPSANPVYAVIGPDNCDFAVSLEGVSEEMSGYVRRAVATWRAAAPGCDVTFDETGIPVIEDSDFDAFRQKHKLDDVSIAATEITAFEDGTWGVHQIRIQEGYGEAALHELGHIFLGVQLKKDVSDDGFHLKLGGLMGPLVGFPYVDHHTIEQACKRIPCGRADL